MCRHAHWPLGVDPPKAVDVKKAHKPENRLFSHMRYGFGQAPSCAGGGGALALSFPSVASMVAEGGKPSNVSKEHCSYTAMRWILHGGLLCTTHSVARTFRFDVLQSPDQWLLD